MWPQGQNVLLEVRLEQEVGGLVGCLVDLEPDILHPIDFFQDLGPITSLHHSFSVVKWGQLSSSVSQRTCENKRIKDCETICCYGDEAYLGAEEPRLETNMFPCTIYLEYGW